MTVLNSLFEKGQCEKLPSLPVVGLKTLEILKNNDFSVDKLSAIISTDPALATRILTMANSALYSHIPRVDSIERAVMLLGARTLRNMALSFVIIEELKSDDLNGFDYEYSWKKSITAAVAAEMLSQILNKRSDDTYVSALLMNIGKLIMYMCEPCDYREVLDKKRNSGVAIAEIERGVFGFDHQKVGSEILKQWNIPQNIYIPISFHHDTEKCPPEHLLHAEILETASAVSSLYLVDKNLERFSDLYEILMEKFGFNKKKVNEFVDDIAVKTVEILDIYNIEPGDMKPYSELIAEANRELSKLSLSYECLLLELKNSEKKEKLPHELAEVIVKIKTFTGLLPICATCKQIRDNKGNWQRLESYIEEHTEAKFTHGVCPDCHKKMIDDYNRMTS